MSSESEVERQVIIWSRRVIWTITFLICANLLRKEWNRWHSTRAYHPKSTTMYHPLLFGLYTLTLLIITFTGFIFIFDSFPTVYFAATQLGNILYSQSRPCLFLYQTAKLQYIFSNKQVKHSKYGYPMWIFIILYIIEVLCALFNIISVSFLQSADNISIYECRGFKIPADLWEFNLIAVFQCIIYVNGQY